MRKKWEKNFIKLCWYLFTDKKSTYIFEDVVTYICEPGYEMNTSGLKTCLSSGDFSEDPKIICNPVSCGQPKVPLYGLSVIYMDNLD